MIGTNLIPLMKLYRIKTYLPINDKQKNMYSAVILNNPDLGTNMKFVEHPMFLSNSKFNTYYIEPRYIEKIRTKQIRINYKKDRDDIYEKINKQYRGIRTPLNITQLNGKNVYYDISIYNEIFFNNIGDWTLKKKIEFYFEYLVSKINSPTLKEYNLKTVFIDVGAWTDKNMNKVDNPVSYLYVAFKRFPELLSTLGNTEFILYSDKVCFRFNPSKVAKNDFTEFKKLITVLSKHVNYDNDKEVDIVDVEKPVEKDEKEDSHYTPVNVGNDEPEKFNFTGKKTANNETEDDPELQFNTEKIEDEDEEPDEEVNKQAMDNIESEAEETDITDEPDPFNDEFGEISSIVKRTRSLREPLSVASKKRNEELKVLQKSIKLEDKTIEELINVKTEDIELIETDVTDKIASTNDNVKTIKFDNFEKVYNEKLMKSDMMKIVTNLNDKSIPVYIRNIKVEDSSDELNHKETYTIQLEDANRIRHSLTFDVPKFIDDRFLYINGSRKLIQKQLTMKPISKTGPDEVQVCSNYNKIFIRRQGKKATSQIEKFKKLTSTNIYGLTIKRGNVSKNNTDGTTPLEYDELAKSYMSIKTKEVEVIFDQNVINEVIKEKKFKIPSDSVCIGFYNKSGLPLLLNKTSETVDGFTIIDYIVNSVGGELLASYDGMKSGTSRYMYSTATIMDRKVPVVLLLGYCEGLTTVLRKANIKYRFSDKKDPGPNESVVTFADGHLIYENIPFKNSILLNGLSAAHPKLYSYDEFDEQDVYVDLFGELFDSRNLANAFNTFYEFMIDPITKEILERLGYPTDFVSVILEANAMLANNSYMVENNMNLFRIRSNEIVNCIIHQEIAKAYARYRDTSHTKNPVKMSIKKDAIIKNLLNVNTVEEFSILNPIYEIEKAHGVTAKGLNGMNTERSYTQDKRAYDPTMTGIIGITTSNDANVGVNRKLTVEPTVMDVRGFVDIKNTNKEELKDVNLFTYSEMLTPMGVTHDDSVRTAMAGKQSGHVIPVAKSSPVLISNGVEQTVQYALSKNFVIVAEDDGEVVEFDEKVGIIVVKYKNGQSQAININPEIGKNSSSGFYVVNKMKTDIKLGDKVKKNDILAYNDKFFTNDGHNGNRYNVGSLQKVAIMSSYSTFEDSTFITQKMANDMASEICMMEDATIGKNANVAHIVKIGDEVQVGDILVEFENSFDDDRINKFLDTVGDTFSSLTSIPIKAKYSGVIEDIKIYCTVDLDELSPSLRKIVSDYYKRINKKKSIINKYDNSKGIVKAGLLLNEPSEKIKPTSDGKVKGRKVFDGVLIEFYIKFYDIVGVGDKATRQ